MHWLPPYGGNRPRNSSGDFRVEPSPRGGVKAAGNPRRGKRAPGGIRFLGLWLNLFSGLAAACDSAASPAHQTTRRDSVGIAIVENQGKSSPGEDYILGTARDELEVEYVRMYELRRPDS